MTIKSRIRFTGCTLSLCVIAYILLPLLTRQEPKILQRAVSISPWALPPEACYTSHHNILATDWKVYPGTTTQKWILNSYNIQTGTKLPLERLTQLVNESGAGVQFSFEQPTSDGKRLLWPTDKLTAISANLDGSRAIRWNCGDIRSIHWLSDDRHWFGLVIDKNLCFTEARIYDRQMPNEVRHLRFAHPIEHDKMNFFSFPSSEQFLSTSFLGPHSGVNDYGSIPKVEFTRWTYSTIMVPTANYTISISPSSKIAQIEASPDGKRLLFVLLRRHESPLAHFALQFWKGFPAHPRYTVELEVSDVDGQNKKLIGVEIEKEHFGQESEQVYDFSWEPDGRHIAFWHDHRLWTILAD